MSVVDNTSTGHTASDLDDLFSHLEPQHIEAFYKQYRHWQLVQQMEELQAQVAVMEQSSVDNAILMQLTQPSPIALAALTRLQSYGVDDVDLLDNMLERGDTWLDHMLQLLEQCQSLGFIRDNYTEWCQHALEGAYDWLDSINENEAAQQAVSMHEQVMPASINSSDTEVLLIQRLMSEEETLKVPAIVGTDASLPLTVASTDKGRDTSVPTDGASVPIPSILSYPIEVQTASEESTQHEEAIPAPVNPVREIPPAHKQQRSPKHGLVSRILSKVWRT